MLPAPPGTGRARPRTYVHTCLHRYICAHRRTFRTPAPTGAPSLAQNPLQCLHAQQHKHTTHGHTQQRNTTGCDFRTHRQNPVPSHRSVTAIVRQMNTQNLASHTHTYSYKEHALTYIMLPTPWLEHRYTHASLDCTHSNITQCLNAGLEGTHPSTVSGTCGSASRSHAQNALLRTS